METEDPRKESLLLDFPVVSPVDEHLRAHPKMSAKEKKIIAVAVGAALTIVVLLGVVFMFRTPEATLVVTVNERDAEITVDDGKVTLKAPGRDRPVEIEVAEGRHTLNVTKGGFQTFTDDFTITPGGREVFDVTLWPKKGTGPISAKHPLGPAGKLDLSPFSRFALPTEAQWEYACRAGTTTFWHFGEDEATLQEYAWFNVNSGGKTHPVGELLANGFGLHDMHGNVWEWCADSWATDYYAELPPNDPSGPSAGTLRVYRGGNWRDHARICRSAIRYNGSPGSRDDLVGFRLASVLADK